MNAYHYGRRKGFSLIELMIALVAGLIVTGAVIVFTLVSLRNNAEYVQATRLTQELRASMDLLGKELARAGYDETALGRIMNAASASPSPFAPIFVSNDGSCAIYAYDRTGGTAGTVDLAQGEIRAIRRMSRTVAGRTVGVIEFAESVAGVTPTCDGASPTYTAYPPACSSNGWCALSDPRVINITQFNLAIVRVTPTTGMQMRTVTATIQGSPVAEPAVVRGMRSTTDVRASCLRTTITDCNAAPTGS